MVIVEDQGKKLKICHRLLLKFVNKEVEQCQIARDKVTNIKFRCNFFSFIAETTKYMVDNKEVRRGCPFETSHIASNINIGFIANLIINFIIIVSFFHNIQEFMSLVKAKD